MARLAILQAVPALLALIQTVSCTPLAFSTLNARNNSGVSWPADVSTLVHDKTWAGFGEKTTRWSSYKAPTFDEVFLPETEEQLSLALEYMSSKNMTWLAKSGGHGYAPSLHAIQDAVLINLENFNYVKMHDDNTAVVGTGVRFSGLIDAVAAAGRELTVGSCPCVGSTGAMLGGGLGRLQGLHGLTSDSLRKVRVALWNGTVVEASDHVNSDLFWGIRGSGQNYGIVIESTYETWPATNGGKHYSADLVFSKDSVQRVMEVTNELTADGLDERLSILMFFALDPASSQITIVVNLVYSGPAEEGRKYTERFSSFSLDVQESMLGWEELPTKTVHGLIPQSCATGPRYNLRSLSTKALHPATWVTFTDAFETFLVENPLAAGSAMMIETFPVQGVRALADDYSAFPHRDHFENVIESIASYTDDSVADAVEGFFRKWRDIFAQPSSSGYDRLYVYQNYANEDEPLSALYGYDEWRHERLTSLKNKFDPRGFFDGYHPVPSDAAGWS
ncbi:FAD-binding domain-containing protein [Colletotrichum somersetense]|nr:FAD-binding domain-containing protein [Colletotrichum somersetense]